jgi:hypothetical protein
MKSLPLLGHRSASRHRHPSFGSVEFSVGRYDSRNVAASVLGWNEKRSPGSVAVPSGCFIGSVAVHKNALRSASAPVKPISPQFIGSVAVRLYNHSLCTVSEDGREAGRSGGDDNAGAAADGSQRFERGRK